MKHRIFILWVIGAALIAFGCGQENDLVSPQLSTAGTLAKHSPGFSYFFFDNPGLPSAFANNGDQIDIGIGFPDPLSRDLFSFHPKTIGGGGAFTIKNAAGDVVLSAGTWTATKLISFQSYGSTFVGDLFGEPEAWGGTLTLEIALSSGQTGILTMTCADFGNPPPGAVQSMRLQIAGGQHFTGVWAFDPILGPQPPTFGGTFFVETP